MIGGPGLVLRGEPWLQNRGRILVGRDVRIDSIPVVSHFITKPGARIELGDRVHVGAGAALMATELIRIEADARLGPFVMILDNDLHQLDSFYSMSEPQPVIIGRGANIGARVVILRGVEIGAGARVLAGSVVTKSIPAGVIAAGAPAAPLGSRGAWLR